MTHILPDPPGCAPVFDILEDGDVWAGCACDFYPSNWLAGNGLPDDIATTCIVAGIRDSEESADMTPDEWLADWQRHKRLMLGYYHDEMDDFVGDGDLADLL